MHESDSLQNFISATRQAVDQYLGRIMGDCGDTEVFKVARYICQNGGHRWRSMSVLATGQIYDPEAEMRLLPVASAVEMVHAASIMLDDMPSMDNARLRRGRPCAHLIFSPWAVDMTAPMLVNLAYETIMRQESFPSECRVAAALEMSKAAKLLCEGQERDIEQQQESTNWNELQKCYAQKTGSLYSAAFTISALMHAAPQLEVAALNRCGEYLGISVQCFDDVADVISNSKDMGKDAGQDIAKPTAVRFFGTEGAIEKGEELLEMAIAELDIFNGRAKSIKRLLQQVAKGLYLQITENKDPLCK